MKERRFKPSYYNFFFEAKDGTHLAFNALSGGFAIIKDENYGKVMEIMANPNKVSGEGQKLLNGIVKGRFIISEDTNEIDILKVRNWSARFNNRLLNLTIAPTLNCNFRCRYCYEIQKGIISKARMNLTVKRALLKFIGKERETLSAINVTWYGGEPLLDLDTIKEISKGIKKLCEEKGIRYMATMVTNGYLLRKEVLEDLFNCGIKSFQITLDGPPSIHNHFRPLRDGSPTFSKILKNIKDAVSSEKFGIQIRVNISQENLTATKDLIELLESERLRDKVKIYPGRIFSNNELLTQKCLDEFEFHLLEVDFSNTLLSHNWRVRLPKLVRASYCAADKLSSYVVDPLGNLYKCWEFIGDEPFKVGSITKEGESQLNSNITYWLSNDPFQIEECRKCKFLPLCMGGCIRESIVSKIKKGITERGRCISLKDNLERKLEIFYYAHQKEKGMLKETKEKSNFLATSILS